MKPLLNLPGRETSFTLLEWKKVLHIEEAWILTPPFIPPQICVVCRGDVWAQHKDFRNACVVFISQAVSLYLHCLKLDITSARTFAQGSDKCYLKFHRIVSTSLKEIVSSCFLFCLLSSCSLFSLTSSEKALFHFKKEYKTLLLFLL